MGATSLSGRPCRAGLADDRRSTAGHHTGAHDPPRTDAPVSATDGPETSPPPDGGAEGERVDPVATERARAQHWREVARARRAEAAAVQRRPLVRAAIAVDRRIQRARPAKGRPDSERSEENVHHDQAPSAEALRSRAARRGDPTSTAPDSESPSARVLNAERAGVRYWRDVAERRAAEAGAVQRRPLVRAAIAVDRRTRRLQDTTGRAATTARSAADRVVLRTAGWRARSGSSGGTGPPRRATAVASRPSADAVPNRPAAVVVPRSRRQGVLVVGLRSPSSDRTDLGALDEPTSQDSHDALDERGPEERLSVAVGWPGVDASPAARRAALREVDDVVAAADAAVVVLVGPATEAGASAIDRLARVATDEGVIAGPIVAHPARPWREATAHDGRVRTVGLAIEQAADGTPTLRHVGAGADPSRVLPPTAPAALTGAALAVRAEAWGTAGGLSRSPVTDLDAAVVDLSLRLGAVGCPVRIVPDAVVVDRRAIRRRQDLRGPLADDGPAWRGLVERHGRRLVPRADDGRLRVALSTATPSRKMAPTSGDWHFAADLARALEAAGHQVVTQTEEEVDDLRGRVCDVHLVLRGLAPVRPTPGQAHVLWVISHPEALTADECDRADLVLVASRRFADDLRSRTTTPIEVMWQATDPVRFAPGTVDPGHRHGITVVANTRGVRRAAVDDALAAGLDPLVHGQGWAGLVDPALLCSEYVAPDALPGVYRSADIVLNDHWETMRRWGFVSNRILDVLACGTPVVSDHLPEIGELFDDLVPTWTDPEELGRVVERMRRDPAETAAHAADARRRVIEHHTFARRVDQLVELLGHHGLVDR